MKKKILVVDDSTSVRQQVGAVLGQAGFEILEAADGVMGCQEIERSADIAMVLCDVNMPNMSGIEMLERVKGTGKHTALPIIMLTTEGQPALVEQAKRAGAKGWIVKPFKDALLVAAVRKIAGA